MGFGSKKRKKKKKQETERGARGEFFCLFVCLFCFVCFFFVLFLLPKPTKMFATSTVPLEKTMIFFIRFSKGWDVC